MPDGVTAKVRNLEKSLARLRRVAPGVDKELDIANQRSANDIVNIAQTLAPRAQGTLARSINAKKIEGQATFRDQSQTGITNRTIQATSAWGIFAAWYWSFVEFGTVKQTKQPFVFPAYRLIRKRHIGRVRRAMSKAIREAFK